MVNSESKTLPVNNNGTVSKTHNRQLKPISFCLDNKDDVNGLNKLKGMKYGLYFKNILKHISDTEMKSINESTDKSEPIIPQSLINYNFKKGFLTCRKIAQLVVKENKVDMLLNELKNFISDDFLLQLVEDRNLSIEPSKEAKKYLSSNDLSYESDLSFGNTMQMSPPPKLFNPASLEAIKDLVRKHENLPAHVEIDSDFIEQFISENPDFISGHFATY